MQCHRLRTLLSEWYQQVRSFTLSPIKMMELVERHISHCEICQEDPDLSLELDQLREIIRVPHIPTQREEKFVEEPVYVAEEDLLEEEEEF
ncbi:MAG: hypothetical protein ACK4K4_00800 [Caldimicrobium sp.]